MTVRLVFLSVSPAKQNEIYKELGTPLFLCQQALAGRASADRRRQGSATRAIADYGGRTNSQPQPDPGNAPADEYASTVDLVRGSDVEPEAISWLWNGWLAAGKVHILGGAPGKGKTTIGMSLAATLTIGGRWPDGARSPTGKVVIWSGEDDPADTLVPRLSLSGADLSRVHFIAHVREGNERRSFDLARTWRCYGASW